MEFALCKSGVREIRYLKDNAKALGRAQGIALHKSLDIVAKEEGFPGGWHDLVTSRWTLDKTMQLHKLDMNRQLALTIVFDGISDPVALDGAKGMSAILDRELLGGKPRDRITFHPLNSDSGIISDPDGQTLFQQAVSDGKLRSRCKLCISLAEQILDDPLLARSIKMNTTVERLIHDLKADQDLLGKAPMHAGKFIEELKPVAYEAFPSRISVKKVTLIYAIGQVGKLMEIERDLWLDVMTETVMSHGDPSASRAACIALFEGLGLKVSSDTGINEQRRDGIEEGP